MNSVKLWAAQRCRLSLDSTESLQSLSAFRRMTALQKAVLLSFARVAAAQPLALVYAREMQAPLYFTSTYGELGPMLRVTQSIIEHDLPVSPKDFQHSVLNASVAYLAMNHAWHQAAFAFSGGFMAPDSTLHLASRRIESGLERACIVIHAHEHQSKQTDDAEAEILILGSQQPDSPYLTLDESRWTVAEETFAEADPGRRIFREEDSNASIPWLIEDGKLLRKRLLMSRTRQALVTTWIPS